MSALLYRAAVLPTLIAVAFSFIVTSAARAETQNRDVPEFHAIALEGAGELIITAGKAQSVALEGDSEILDGLITEVRDGTLHIHRQKRSFWSFDFGNKSFTARVTLPQVTAASIMGSGLITAAGLDGGDTDFTINGSGKVEADGRVKKLRFVINGSGSAEMSKLTADAASVTVNGSGNVIVNAQSDLNATINGSGSVRYVGAPARLSRNIHGSGSIDKKD